MNRKTAYLIVLSLVIFLSVTECTCSQNDSQAIGGEKQEQPTATVTALSPPRQETQVHEQPKDDSTASEKKDEPQTPEPKIRIISPEDNSKVEWRPMVTGTVADPNAEIWVVVHPMKVSKYWVQPRVNVKKDGTWRVIIYIGRAGSEDVGEMYEIIAVANPKIPIKEGLIPNTSGWPEAEYQSEVIYVTRK